MADMDRSGDARHRDTALAVGLADIQGKVEAALTLISNVAEVARVQRGTETAAHVEALEALLREAGALAERYALAVEGQAGAAAAEAQQRWLLNGTDLENLALIAQGSTYNREGAAA